MGAGAGVGAVLLSTAGPGQPRGQKGWAERGPGSWGASAQTATQSPWLLLATLDRWWRFLRVQGGGPGSVQKFIEHTPGLGLGWGLSHRWWGEQKHRENEVLAGSMGWWGVLAGHFRSSGL